MATNQTQQDVDQQATAEVALINDRELIERFAEMAVMIPADNSGGTEDILRKILSAETWNELDEPWQASNVDDILGRTMHITKVTRRPSTMAGGLGQFLVIHLQDAKTGKEYVKTTGSIAVVGQIARAYALGLTALTVEWCRAERPTAGGFFPQHLRVIDAATPDPATAR